MNTQNDIPKVSDDDADYSVDVITSDSEGMLCIAYYCFPDKEWCFHSDTLYEGYANNFVWMYAPENFKAPQID